MNKEIIDAIKSTKTVDELKNLAAKNGYKLTNEETEKYFDIYHGSEKIKDNDLDNVAGGACNVGTGLDIVAGQTYSTKPPYDLIVTQVNHCKGYEERDPFPTIGIDGTCVTCCHSYGGGPATVYCSIRHKDNDPYK